MGGSGGLTTDRQAFQAVLAPDADAPRVAREFAVRTLRRWGVPQWAEPVGLVVSELVTNAVRHAGTPATLRLVPAAAGVVVQVEDGSETVPRLLPPDSRTVSGGLGLAIVDRLAQEWGCTDRADGPGKTVWARLRLPGGPGPDPEAEPVVPEEVVLALPFDKDLVAMVRSAVAHLAVRAGFERRELEDLRLAADEIFALLYAQRPPGGAEVAAIGATTTGAATTDAAITCRFLVAPGRVAVTMTAPVPPRRPPDLEDFGWHLVQALVDEIEWEAAEGTCAVHAEKRKGGGAS